MSRRKKPRKQTETQKQQQILQKIHVEIPVDYELLAKEILKQQELLDKAKETVEKKKEDNSTEKICFCKVVWGIIRNKRDTEGVILSNGMATVLSVFFILLGYGLLLLSVVIFAFVFLFALAQSWSSFSDITRNILGLLFILILSFSSLVYGVAMIGAGHEIDQEEDRNYIVDVFSGIIGFVALIVSLIALFKQ